LHEPADAVVELSAKLQAAGIACRSEEPLARHTTIGLGGPAELFAQPKSVQELARVLDLARAAGVPVRVLGAGSNLIVDDRGVRGIVIHTGALAEVRFLAEPDEGLVEAGAGVHFPALVRQTASRGLRGLEAGVGIPGSLGGVLTMNAGAYDFSIGPRVVEVEAVSPEAGPMVLAREQIDFRYRSSSFGENLVVAKAKLRLEPGDPAAIKRDMDRHMRFRKETQPVGVKSAGCIFKNPEGGSAGKLIDGLGLKGFRVGGARVSEVHANFIVHDGSANASEVRDLIDAVREKVRGETAILLETEVMTWSP
jgi:UDP-N-acetylmuramate dehydrogenase